MRRNPAAAATTADLPSPLGLASVTDRQTVTLRCDEGDVPAISVSPGLDWHASWIVSVDTSTDLTLRGADGGDLPAELREWDRLLHPPRPDWRVCAEEFWRHTAADRGMPAELVVSCADADGGSLVLGGGAPSFGITADARSLQLLFTGALQPDDAVRSGRISVRGTFPQLSVIVGATWKVRMDG